MVIWYGKEIIGERIFLNEIENIEGTNFWTIIPMNEFKLARVYYYYIMKIVRSEYIVSSIKNFIFTRWNFSLVENISTI